LKKDCGKTKEYYSNW